MTLKNVALFPSPHLQFLLPVKFAVGLFSKKIVFMVRSLENWHAVNLAFPVPTLRSVVKFKKLKRVSVKIRTDFYISYMNR